MNPEIIKKDDNTITVITPTSQDISYDDLIAQRDSIQAQKDLAVYQLDQQLADVQTMIDKCVSLNVGPVVDMPVTDVTA